MTSVQKFREAEVKAEKEIGLYSNRTRAMLSKRILQLLCEEYGEEEGENIYDRGNSPIPSYYPN